MEDKIINIRKAQLLSFSIAIPFLVIHTGLIFMFRYYGIIPMFYFNIGSSVFYFIMLFVIACKGLRFFIVASYIEVVAHMTAAVIFIGWGSGFQISLIGINFLLFFAEYTARTIRIPHTNSVLLSILGALSYVASFVYLSEHPAPYSLPPEVEFRMQILWAVIVFSITIGFLKIFVELAFRGEQFLAKRASKDELTGLYNRYYLMDHLHKISNSEGLNGYFITMIDIDDFKKINDTYGHNCGDYVLKTIASLLKDNSFGAKTCRWGGEEFILVGPMKNSSMDEQYGLLDELRSSIEKYEFTYDGTSLNVTVTMGVAAYEEGISIEEWIHMADKKLYVGKCGGKNKVII
ncbi:MAG: diguanylate cyclase [Lachnospiraceae bacterium]|nr:diguanylate cyclase [Lachnospiraceae bacterium]